MPVNVIGTLKPKNNGKFPVAEAVDIKVTDYLRLDEALENKADLSSVNFALDNKADKTTTTSLQSQINEIITPVTQDAEVQNARVDLAGISHTTLKERIDTSEIQIKSDISGLKDRVYDNSETEINILSTLDFKNKGFYDKTTGIYEPTSIIYGTTDKLEIPKNAVKYDVSIYAYSRMSGVTFFDENEQFISSHATTSDTVHAELITELIEIPLSAKYVAFSSWTAPDYIKEIDKKLVTDRLNEEIEALEDETDGINSEIDHIYDTISDLSNENVVFVPCGTPERTTANDKIFAYNDSLTSGAYKVTIETTSDVKIYLFTKIDSSTLSLIKDYTITPTDGTAVLEFSCDSEFIIAFQGEIGFVFGNGYVFLDISKNNDTYTYTTGGNSLKFKLSVSKKEKKNLRSYYGIPYIFNTNTEIKIKLLGDSITQGSGSTGYVEWNDGTNTYRGNGPDYPNKWEGYEVGDYLGHSGTLYWYESTSGSGWGQLIKAYLEEKFNVSVKDYGMGGATSADILIRLSDLVTADDDIITLMVGTNDRRSRSLDEFTSTLDNLISKLLAMGKEVILISPSPLSVAAEESSTYFHAEDINNALSYMAFKYGLKFISVFDDLTKFAEYRDINVDTFLNSDGVHPNDAGYARMFSIISRGLGIGVKRNGANW